MFHLEKQYYDVMIAHLRSGYPNEACGLIAGKDGKVLKVIPAMNVDPNPRVRYQIDPKELLQVFRLIDDQGWDLIGIFHSHPHTQAYPSATDISLAFYPDAIYFICSLRDVDRPDLHAFRIVEGEIKEEEIEIAK